MKGEHKAAHVRHSSTEMTHHAVSPGGNAASKAASKPVAAKTVPAAKAEKKGGLFSRGKDSEKKKKKKKQSSNDHDYIRPSDVLMISSDSPSDQPLHLQWAQRVPSNRPHPADLNASVEDDSMSGDIERLIYETSFQLQQWDDSILRYTEEKLEASNRYLEQIRRELGQENSSSLMSPEQGGEPTQLQADEKALARQIKALEARHHFHKKHSQAFGGSETPRAASAQINGTTAEHGGTTHEEHPKFHATATFHRHFGTPVEKVEALELDRVWGGIFKWPHLLLKPEVQQYWLNEDKTILVRGKEHKASWSELLFDLVFVIVLSYLAGGLETDFSGRALMEYLVLFFAVWRIWENANVYVNRFHPRDAFHKLYFILEMACVMGIAINTFHGVIICYLVARAITEALMLFSAIFDPRVRPRAYADGALFAVSAIPWIVSAFLDNNAETIGAREHPDYLHLSLWGGGLFIEVLGFIFVRNIPALSLPVNIEHLAERYGLFTMIVLGEQVAVLLFYAEEATNDTYGCACLGGMLVFDIFICYFEVEAAKQGKHAIFRGSTKYKLWYWGHLVFHGAVIAAASGVRALIHSTSHSGSAHSGIVSNISVASLPYARYLFGVAIAIAYFMLSLFGFLNRPDESVIVPKKLRLFLRLLTATAALVLPFVATYTDNLTSAVEQLAVIVAAATLSGIVEVLGGVPRIDPNSLKFRQVLHMKPNTRKVKSSSRSSVVDPSSVVSTSSSDGIGAHPTRTVSLPTPRKESAAMLSGAPATFEDRNRPGSLATLTIDTPSDATHLLRKESGSGKPLSPVSGSAPVSAANPPVNFNTNQLAAQ